MKTYHIIVCFFCSCLTAVYADYRILAFGDSNTWGWQPMGGGARFIDTDRWTGVLATELGRDYTVITDGLVARRTNIDGMDTKLVPGSFLNGATTLSPAIARNAPLDLVILFLGTNDLQLGAERSAKEVAEAVLSLVNQAKESSNLLYSKYEAPPQIWVVVPPALGELQGTPLESLFSVGYEESKKLSESFRKLLQAQDIQAFYCDDISEVGADGIHLTKSGHQALGLAIAGAIKETE